MILASFIFVRDRKKILRIAEKRHMHLSEFEILDEKDESPIIMVSRADTHEIKLNSIALSMLL